MWFKIYVLWFFVINAITILMYLIDKKRAKKHAYRMKESILIWLTIIGGSLGALFGLYVIRHKNRHWYFVFITFISLVIHLLLGVIIYN